MFWFIFALIIGALICLIIQSVGKNDTGIYLPYWTDVFPYWDYLQIQQYRIFIEEKYSIVKNMIEPRGGSWNNVNVLRNNFNFIGSFRSMQPNIVFDNTALTIPEFNLQITRSGQIVVWEYRLPRLGSWTVLFFGTHQNGSVYVGTSHNLSGIGSFRVW